MFRIDSTGAVTSLPTPASVGSTIGYFTDGNPGTGTPATIVSNDWLNMVQEELMSILTAGGVTESKTSYNQVLTALQSVVVGVGGQMRGLIGSSAGGVKTASWTIQELVAETSLGGMCYKGSSLSLSFNGAGTGAGGMDTGSMPTAADLSIYAIYDPTSATWATLGCAGSTSNGLVYSGSHMPTGYTASALIWAGVTSSGDVTEFYQRDRTVWGPGAAVFNGSTSAATYTSFSVSSWVPAAATYFGGSTQITSSVSNTVYLAADANGTGGQENGTTSLTAASAQSFANIPLITPQTAYYKIAGSSATVVITIISYAF